MPKDKRLYMTLPIEFPEHPKVEPLSDAAFRCFIEMNAYSRRVDSDGVIPVNVAEKRWKRKVLNELIASDKTRPLILIDSDSYVIRDYAEHQHTKADRDALTAKRTEAGKYGASKRWHGDSKPIASAMASAIANGDRLPKQMHSKPIAESESESELQIQVTSNTVSQVSNAREILTDASETPEEVESSMRLASGLGLDLTAVINAASKADRRIGYSAALQLGSLILSKASREPRNATGYVMAAFKSNPFEVQKLIDTEVLV